MLRDAMCKCVRVAVHRAVHGRAFARSGLRARARRILSPSVYVRARVCVCMYAATLQLRTSRSPTRQSGRTQLGRDFDSRQLGRNRERGAAQEIAPRNPGAIVAIIAHLAKGSIARRAIELAESPRSSSSFSIALGRIMANNGARPRRCIRLVAIIVVPKHVNYTGGYKRQYDRPEAGEASLRPGSRLYAASPPPTGQSEIISLLKSMRA